MIDPDVLWWGVATAVINAVWGGLHQLVDREEPPTSRPWLFVGAIVSAILGGFLSQGILWLYHEHWKPLLAIGLLAIPLSSGLVAYTVFARAERRGLQREKAKQEVLLAQAKDPYLRAATQEVERVTQPTKVDQWSSLR